MPTVKHALTEAAHALKKNVQTLDQAWNEAEILLAHALKKDRTWLLAHPETVLTLAKSKAFAAFIKRRLKHEPLAYLLGHADFAGRRFKTDKRALIPRPETEELVERALGVIKNDPTHTLVCDVGTGSGAIAVTLKAESPNTPVFASDVDPKPITLAKENAMDLLGSTKAVRFMQGNLLPPELQAAILRKAKLITAKQFVLVANLPYLPLSDKKFLAPDVVKFEPSKALFTSQEGNALIVNCFKQLAKFLPALPLPTIALFECDPPQAKALKKLALQQFPDADVAVHQDFCGRDRFLEIKIPAR